MGLDDRVTPRMNHCFRSCEPPNFGGSFFWCSVEWCTGEIRNAVAETSAASNLS
jgi:hypothetical protein